MVISPRQFPPERRPDSSHFAAPHLRLLPRHARVAVLLNANAKRVTTSVLRAFERIMPKDDLFFSRSIEEAQRFAHTIIERRYGVVLAGGGDGTIAGAMNHLLRAAEAMSVGLYRPSLPDIGVLRLGTGNGLAAATGAGHPIEDAMKMLAGDEPMARPLQLIEDKGSRAVYPFMSLGYDAQLLNDYLDCTKEASSEIGRQLMKTLAGYFYALATRTIPHELKGQQPHLRVVARGRCSIMDPETDEEIPLQNNATLFEGAARAVAMATTPFYGFKMKVFPFAERRSDRFHLRVATGSIPFVLGHLPALWKGTLRSGFVDFLVEGAHIESSVPMPYQGAGDALGLRRSLDLDLSARTFRVLDHKFAKAPALA